MAKRGKRCKGTNGNGVCKFKGITVDGKDLCPRCITIQRQQRLQQRANEWVSAHHAKLEADGERPERYSLAEEGAAVFGAKFQEG